MRLRGRRLGTLDEAGEGKNKPVRVDFASGTGTGTRYERIAGIDGRDYYPDWASGRSAAGWTSSPSRSRPR